MDKAINRLVESQNVPLKKIGQGFCGTVWSKNEENGKDLDLALKREDGGPGRSIVHEYRMHEHVLATLKCSSENLGKFRVDFPFCEGLLRRDSPQWHQILPQLPSGFEPCNALLNEKIPSMPEYIQTRLASTFHPEAMSLPAAATIVNDHCIIRPYLGRRRYKIQANVASARTRPSRLAVFSHRNFPLYLDQVEQLGLPAKDYAIAMADTLAFLYWTVKVDANDIEFVLAPDRRSFLKNTKPAPGIGSTAFESEFLSTHAMWALDLDCCRDMAMTKDGVHQAVRSFLRNDPFYPRPPSSRSTDFDQQLWDIFQSRFLETSHSILKEEEGHVQQLPNLLVDEIVQNCRKQQDPSPL